MSSTEELRRGAYVLFLNEAHERDGGALTDPEEHELLLRAFGWSWSLEWENKQKEMFWRLAVDGVADGHRWASLGARGCACGVQHPRREHFFWACPVARAVVMVLEASCPGGPHLTKVNVWLMCPPEGVAQQVWVVVCLAALNSMDEGRRKLLRKKLERRAGGAGVADPDYGTRRVTRPSDAGRVLSNGERVQMAKTGAVLDFWGRLADFAALSRPPNGEGGLRVGHPFLHLVNGKLKVNRGV